QARPWWREPWPWLLMAGPFVAMIGCGVTIWLAISHPDVAIHDNVVRHGLVVEKTTVTPTHGIHAEAR
ncbi:FixH family protein, partial [Salmonella sp. hn-h4]